MHLNQLRCNKESTQNKEEVDTASSPFHSLGILGHDVDAVAKKERGVTGEDSEKCDTPQPIECLVVLHPYHQ